MTGISTKAAVSVPAARLVQVLMVPSATPQWLAPYGPYDREQRGVDFSDLLAGDMIKTILSLDLTAEAVALGFQIDTDSGRAPVIDTAGQIVGLHFRDDPAFQGNVAWSVGLLVGVDFTFLTAATDFRIYRRRVWMKVLNQ